MARRTQVELIVPVALCSHGLFNSVSVMRGRPQNIPLPITNSDRVLLNRRFLLWVTFTSTATATLAGCVLIFTLTTTCAGIFTGDFRTTRRLLFITLSLFFLVLRLRFF